MIRQAERHHAFGRAVRRAVVLGVRREWRKLDPNALDESFAPVWPRLLDIITAGQLRAAGEADKYLTRLHPLVERVGRVDPEAFAGIAADGRDLVSLTRMPLIAAKSAVQRGETPRRALSSGQIVLERLAGSETADAGRTADQVATAARPELTGYVRMLTLPSCARCAVLAGQVYKWNTGFARHPLCDCRHIPVAEDAEDLTTDARKAIEAGQVRMSKADREAILDGADVSQVINAHRGMYKAADGRKLTREGKSKRGWYGGGYASGKRRKGKAPPRLRPEEIYKQAGSREAAIVLLREHGYFVNN